MKLPQTAEIDELNRLLFAVAGLSVQDRGCSIRSAVTLCTSVALGGRPADHRRTIRLCSYAGFALVRKRRIMLTELGEEFLALNTDSTYELSHEQRRFLVERVIFPGPWRSPSRDLFLHFSANYSEITYELDENDNPLPLRCRSAVSLFRKLGVLQRVEHLYRVAPEYVALVAQVLADHRGTTEEELGRALQENRTLGAQAEEAVVEYERRRLKALGRDVEASLVRRISHLDVGAGYDIQSYDGTNPLFDYDRFIEVKASYRSELRLYWSANEFRAAEELGSKYWIYFVGNFRGGHADRIEPIMIQDPASRLSRISQLDIGVSTYVVTQQGELTLRPSSVQDIKGFLL